MPTLADRTVRWLLALAFWTLIGVTFASQFYFSSAQFGNPVTWQRALTHSLADWYVFALLSIPALWLARRCPIELPGQGCFARENSVFRRRWGRALALHAFAGTLFSAAYMTLRASIALRQAAEPISFAQAFEALLVKTWHFNVLVYFVIVAVHHAFDYYKKFRERELRTVELERRLTEARLQALQMQLNPHFLFNTLHAISSLMHQDVEAADKMLVRLSDLLRHALESTNTQEVSLREELDFLSRYLEIEQARFGERLKIVMFIEPDTLDALVPNLVLQPLLENAIRHGIEPHARQGRIEVRARRDGNSLQLQVSDNGGGISNGELIEGVGVSNTRARLQQLYGDRQRIEFTPSNGLVVAVTIPFHTGNAFASPEKPPVSAAGNAG